MERFGFEYRSISHFPDIPPGLCNELQFVLMLVPEPGGDRLSGKVDMQSILENLPEATSGCTRGEKVVGQFSFLVAKNTNGVDVWIYFVQAFPSGKTTM